MASTRASKMPPAGMRIPDTLLVVDYWESCRLPPHCLYFLTHMHADHTVGLNSSWRHTIHCSPITARLLMNKFDLSSARVHILELDVPHLLHMKCPFGKPITVTVTAIDANHCPGSIMFYFEGYFGKILYTGDFRVSEKMLAHPKLLDSPDVVYIDNTYCHPDCLFPTRAVAMEEIKQVVSEARFKDINYRFYVGLPWVGKEEINEELAMLTDECVGVSREYFNKLQQISSKNIYTRSMHIATVTVTPFYGITIRNVEKWNSEQPTIAIYPTARFIGPGAPDPPLHPNIRIIPYSDHSSYKELLKFVATLRPHRVCPIVCDYSGSSSIGRTRTDMSCFDHLLNTDPPFSYVVPDSVHKLLHSVASNPLSHRTTPTTLQARPSLSQASRPHPKGVQFLPIPAKYANSSNHLNHTTSANSPDHTSLPKLSSNSPSSESTSVSCPQSELVIQPQQQSEPSEQLREALRPDCQQPPDKLTCPIARQQNKLTTSITKQCIDIARSVSSAHSKPVNVISDKSNKPASSVSGFKNRPSRPISQNKPASLVPNVVNKSSSSPSPARNRSVSQGNSVTMVTIAEEIPTSQPVSLVSDADSKPTSTHILCNRPVRLASDAEDKHLGSVYQTKPVTPVSESQKKQVILTSDRQEQCVNQPLEVQECPVLVSEQERVAVHLISEHQIKPVGLVFEHVHQSNPHAQNNSTSPQSNPLPTGVVAPSNAKPIPASHNKLVIPALQTQDELHIFVASPTSQPCNQLVSLASMLRSKSVSPVSHLQSRSVSPALQSQVHTTMPTQKLTRKRVGGSHAHLPRKKSHRPCFSAEEIALYRRLLTGDSDSD